MSLLIEAYRSTWPNDTDESAEIAPLPGNAVNQSLGQGNDQSDGLTGPGFFSYRDRQGGRSTGIYQDFPDNVDDGWMARCALRHLFTV